MYKAVTKALACAARAGKHTCNGTIKLYSALCATVMIVDVYRRCRAMRYDACTTLAHVSFLLRQALENMHNDPLPSCKGMNWKLLLTRDVFSAILRCDGNLPRHIEPLAVRK